MTGDQGDAFQKYTNLGSGTSTCAYRPWGRLHVINAPDEYVRKQVMQQLHVASRRRIRMARTIQSARGWRED
eukprot:6210935-Pleurochrysis_carterae.AAC.1